MFVNVLKIGFYVMIWKKKIDVIERSPLKSILCNIYIELWMTKKSSQTILQKFAL
jgi:hypothetical protein